MALLSGLMSIAGFIFCCAFLFVLFLCVLVVWYWRNQPNQKTSATAPEPTVQATIEHPTAAAPAAPVAPAPEAPTDTAPPSADA